MLVKILSSVSAFIFICLLWSLIEPSLVRIKRFRIANILIPAEFSGFKIAFISDLHIGKYDSLKRIDKIISRLEKENIDLLLLGGDYVFRYSGDEELIFAPFMDPYIPEGVYAVTGNHDSWEAGKDITDAMDRAGVTNINNRKLNLSRNGSSIEICGVPDLWDYDFSDGNIPAGKNGFRILVSHNPDYLAGTGKSFDLGLAGHTHGGQITFFGLFAPVLPIENKRYWRGLYKLEKGELIISNGLGTAGLPMRFSAPPEILLIELKSTD